MTLNEALALLRRAKHDVRCDGMEEFVLETPDGHCQVRDIRVEATPADPENPAAGEELAVVVEVEPAAFTGDGQDNY
jgi:hypothetical protein